MMLGDCTRCGIEVEVYVKNSTLCPECHAIAKDEWATPPDLWEAMKRRWDFQTDVCASVDNKKCERYFDKKRDALDRTPGAWVSDGDAWCNPGFSKPWPWMIKAKEESFTRADAHVVVCGIADCSTALFQYAATHCSRIFLLRPRVQYVPAPGITASTNSKPSVLYEFDKSATATRAQIFLWNWKET